ncbi:dnaJ homolog subfamily B member 7-like isoform X2 [Bolinopsis microptera]|uniref:dnaJ homolog subfamily B member 7-like isoform X2 n=1 Tax=Bolinopsis microptera TaxID=2820187 RepID=UPI00307B06A0
MLLRAIPIVRPICVRCITHYEVLDIPKTATKSDIKKAYLEKAKECHPDLNPDNEKAAVKFQEIQEAHDVLINSKLRAQYNHNMNQESYYGTQRTHKPEDGSRKSNVRTHGVNNQYNRRRNNEFHDNHRVNRDNYSYPGNQKDFYTDPYSSVLSRSIADQTHYVYMLGLGVVGIFLYGIVSLVNGVKEEVNDGRHGKYKMVENQFANAKARMNNSEGFWSKFSISPRSSKPVSDTVKYVWSEEKGNLVKMTTLPGHGMGLKKKFDETMQSNLGQIEAEEEVKPVVEEVKKAVTLAELGLLKIEMSKKRSEYLAAKKEYNEILEVFTEEQKKKKSKSRKHEVI